jgi:hypothetical protein
MKDDEVVSRELLEEFAARYTPAPASASASGPRSQPHTGHYAPFDPESFINRYLDALPPVEYQGGRKWVLEHCPWDETHVRDAAVYQYADGSLGFKCFHNGCANYHWQDLRDKFEPDRPRAKGSSWQPSDSDVPPEYRQAPGDRNGHGSEAEPPPNASEHTRPAGAPAASEPAGALITRRLADIEPIPVKWLWRKRIPRGKLTIFAGLPGLGKSQTTASIAATVTNGGQWAVDRTPCECASVIFLTAEDDAEDTLRPRLEAAGADLTRVHLIEGVVAGYTGNGVRRKRIFSLETDVDALNKKLTEIADVAVVIVDPVSAYLGDTDSHVNAEVRGLLMPLCELAAQHQVAIIGVDHLNKNVGAEAILRLPGSIAFVAAARASYLVTPDPADNTRQLFLPLKCNLAPKMPGLAYRIESATVSSRQGGDRDVAHHVGRRGRGDDGRRGVASAYTKAHLRPLRGEGVA